MSKRLVIEYQPQTSIRIWKSVGHTKVTWNKTEHR